MNEILHGRAAILMLTLAGWIPAAADPLKDALQIQERFQAQRQQIEKQSQDQLSQLRAKAIQDLLRLHDQCRDANQTAPAERILTQLVLVAAGSQDLLEEPTTMSAHSKDVGRHWLARVTGDKAGTVWGTHEYTADSRVATAAVHTGVVAAGETALLLILITPGRQSYRGTQRNEIASNDYNAYGTSYQLLRIGPVPQR